MKLKDNFSIGTTLREACTILAEVERVAPCPASPSRTSNTTKSSRRCGCLGGGGTISAIAAIIGAIENVLEPFGVRISGAPITPFRSLELTERAHKN